MLFNLRETFRDNSCGIVDVIQGVNCGIRRMCHFFLGGGSQNYESFGVILMKSGQNRDQSTKLLKENNQNNN